MQKNMIIAYDLGTGGIKASLFDIDGRSHANTFAAYETDYNGKFHEQGPDLWWNGVIETTRLLLDKSKIDPMAVVGMAISGHSLGVVPVDKDGRLLREVTPIWSDARAEEQARRFFKEINYEKWYMTTGNGFPAELYSVFKMMWYKDHERELYDHTYKILGSKDYCNLRLTGRMCTDHSYASGSGVYSLLEKKYLPEYINAADVRGELFPEIIASHEKVGHLTPQAAGLLGLSEHVAVMAGGVDNSCMALGSKGIADGRAYLSLGSSSWIAITSKKPILDTKYKPFVFAHVADDMYASATSIFAAGSSFRWVRDNICTDILEKEKKGEIKDAYLEMNQMIQGSPIGANKLIFNPSLAGGASFEESKNICGGFVGLTMSHTRNDLVRSAMEGITYNLKYVFDILTIYQKDIKEMLLVGGGAKSQVWRQMFADVFGIDIVKTCIDQDAASLGAASLVAYGLGYWNDYTIIDKIHEIQSIEKPDKQAFAQYQKFYKVHRDIAHFMALSGDELTNVKIS